MDVRLLVEIASEMVLHRLPCSRAEAEAVLRECLNVLRLWNLMQTRPLDQLGSETKTKQILAEYLRRRHEQNSADGKCISQLREKRETGGTDDGKVDGGDRAGIDLGG